MYTWFYGQNKFWEKFVAFLKTHVGRTKNIKPPRKIVSVFLSNFELNDRFTFVKFPPPPPLLHRNVYVFI